MKPWLGLLVLCAACGRTSLVDASAADGGTGPGPASCSAKVRFDQAHGCLNDGAIEICAKDEPRTALELFSLAPGTQPAGTPGWHCTAPDLAYLWPLSPQEAWCVEFHGAMNDDAWKIVCATAARPDVSLVAPYWAE